MSDQESPPQVEDEPINETPQYPTSSVFEVAYPSGATEIVIHEAEDVDAFVASKFGSVDHVEYGVTVTKMSDADAEAHIEGIRNPPAEEVPGTDDPNKTSGDAPEVATDNESETEEVDHNETSQDDDTHQGGATGEEEPTATRRRKKK